MRNETENDDYTEGTDVSANPDVKCVYVCVLCVTDSMNVILLLCQNQPMGSYMFFCLQYILIFFENVFYVRTTR